MKNEKIINIETQNNKEKITIKDNQTVLFHNGEKIEFKGLILAGDSVSGERIVISGGISFEQTVLLEKEISYRIFKLMEDRF